MSRMSQPQSAPRTRRTGGAAGASSRRIGMRLAAAGLVAVAGLSLTACGQSDDALKTSDGRPFDAAPQDHLDTGAPGKNGGVHADGGQASGSGAGKENKTTASGSGGSGGGRTDSGHTGNAPGTDGTTPPPGDAGGAPKACDPADLTLTASALPRPVNHLLLEAKNTSGTTCDLYSYPFLRFDEAQSPLAPLAESKPQSVLSLAPGASGYASIMTSSGDGSGTNGHQRTSLSLSLADRDEQGGGASVPVALPGGSAYLDDSAWVTYWQPDAATAANW
ncbi:MULTISPECIES: DUF4232 domain-containing protein [Streptomyces]|uniref:DUF4232 domain-containing protein n=1 Tax=Streptomyces ramulosus TaxID=47762 RepID=A0ABW1FNH8_9ACTN